MSEGDCRIGWISSASGYCLFLFRELLVELEELGDALALGHRLDGEAVGGHHSAVVVLVGSAELNGHRQFVVYRCPRILQDTALLAFLAQECLS